MTPQRDQHSNQIANNQATNTQAGRDYQRIAAAIEFIGQNFQDNPSLDEIAAAVHVSPFHFQRLFSRWAGVSPKKFGQFLSLGYAKTLLAQQQAPVLDVAHATGLSGGGRLHDLFITIEGMTPGQFKQGGAGLRINHALHDSPFGPVFIASTEIGICHMAFIDGRDEHDVGRDGDGVRRQRGFAALQRKFPNAAFCAASDPVHHRALAVFEPDDTEPDQITLHLSGTAFQLKVWEALLRIPAGSVASYEDVASTVCSPAAARATGAAIGANAVAYLIPCHRVIQKSGHIGGFRWGVPRKRAIIGWEGARQER